MTQDNERQQRMDGLRLFDKMTRTVDFQRKAQHWQEISGGTHVTVVPVLDTDTVSYTQDAVDRAGGNARVVVYYPKQKRIAVVLVSDRDRGGRPLIGSDRTRLHPDSHIGMLLELVLAAGTVYATTEEEVLAAAT